MEILKNKFGKVKYREMLWINGNLNKSPRFSRKTDAIHWKAEQLLNKEKFKLYGHNKLNQKISFSEMSDKWLSAKNSMDLAKATLKKYNDFCRVHFIPLFGNRDLKSIQKSEIENFQTSLRKSHNAKGTNLIMTGLKSIFREAVKEGYLNKSPCEFVKKISADHKQYRFWTKSEVDQFLKANFHSEFYDLILVALNTGMRKGELSGLCWDRVDFLTNTIIISRTRDMFELKERTKTNHVRVIPMNEVCRASLLKLFKNKTSGSKYVFLNSLQEKIEPHHLCRTMLNLQKKAGITNLIRFHDLRHTFASQYIMNGGSIYDLQKFLGHTSIVMTQVYAHQSMDYLQSAMKGFGLGQAETESADEPTLNLTFLNDRTKLEPRHEEIKSC
jgi:integrase